MQTSESINELAAALAKAQGAFDVIHKTRSVKVRLKENKGEYTFRYAPLDEVLRATRGPLSDNGLAVCHPCDTTEAGKIRCGTRLVHCSGQWVESTLEFVQQSSLQDVGSALTYLKRYTLCGLLGVTADEDDDANAADGNEAEVGEVPPKPVCPNCSVNLFVYEDKEHKGSFYCWKKKGGCGAKWTAQEQGPKPTRGRKKSGDSPEDPKHAVDPVSAAKARLSAFTTFASFLPNFDREIEKISDPFQDTALRQFAIEWIKKHVHLLTQPAHCEHVKNWCIDHFPDSKMCEEALGIVMEQEKGITTAA